MTDPRQLRRWPKLITKKYELAKNSTEFSITPIDEDKLGEYYIMLKPTGGHYKGQIHILEFKSKRPDGNLFPFVPPIVKFKTAIFHPNIDFKGANVGAICVDILRETKQWSPQYDINAVMSSIILLLDVPNNSSPYNGHAAKLHNECNETYKKRTKDLHECKELDRIYNECFEPYALYTREFATTPVDSYMKYFEIDLEEKMSEMKL